MKNFLIIETGISVFTTVFFGVLSVVAIILLFKFKYFNKVLPNQAQITLLSGRITAAVILLSGVFNPLRDYLVISNSGPLQGSVWIFRAICLLAVCISYFIALGIEEILFRIIFPGLSLEIALNENNVIAGLIRAVLLICFSFILLFSIEILLPLLIPAPRVSGIN